MSSPRKYEILCPLRAGAGPRNFLAFNTGVGGFRRLVMLRLLSDEKVADDALPARLLSQAKACAPFSHPFLAAAYEPEVIEGRLYLALEYVAGATLAEIAEACRGSNQRLPLGLVLRAARDAAYALHYAHTFTDGLGRRRPRVHGALTDASVLVSYEGSTRVVDFAWPREPGRGAGVFASPEQVRGLELDGRADLFSLGAVVHSLVTGTRHQYAEVLGRAPSKTEFPPPSEANTEATSALDVCLMQALYPNRDSRYTTALEFARDLERIAASLLFTPEQCGSVVQRLFSARREQLKTLVTREEGDPTTAIREPPVAIDAQPLLAAADGEPEATRQLRMVSGTAKFGGAADPEYEPVTGKASPPPPSPYDEEDPKTVQITGPAWAKAAQNVPSELLGGGPTGRFDVVPPTVLGPRASALGGELSSPTAQFRAALFEDVPPTGPMPALKLPPPADGGAESFASEPTRSLVTGPPARRRPVLKLFLALVALGAIGLASAWVLSPSMVLGWYAELDGRLRGAGPPAGEEDPALPTAEEPDAGAPDAPEELAQTSGDEAPDAGQSAVDAGAVLAAAPAPGPLDAGVAKVAKLVKPVKAVKPTAKPGKKKRRR
ncbi:MAG: serine/threonine protein kinase [Myxococcaceae bacterium]